MFCFAFVLLVNRTGSYLWERTCGCAWAILFGWSDIFCRPFSCSSSSVSKTAVWAPFERDESGANSWIFDYIFSKQHKKAKLDTFLDNFFCLNHESVTFLELSEWSSCEKATRLCSWVLFGSIRFVWRFCFECLLKKYIPKYVLLFFTVTVSSR